MLLNILQYTGRRPFQLPFPAPRPSKECFGPNVSHATAEKLPEETFTRDASCLAGGKSAGFSDRSGLPEQWTPSMLTLSRPGIFRQGATKLFTLPLFTNFHTCH